MYHVLCLDMLMEGGLQLKGSLAKRLGGFVDSTENKIDMPPKKVKSKCSCITHDAYRQCLCLYHALMDLFISAVLALRPVRERLGVSSDITEPKSPNSEPKPSGEIRIKTLEEIRQEKAAKSQTQSKGVRAVTQLPSNTLTSTKKVRRPVTGPGVKTFSEILHEKKKLQETKEVPQQGGTSTEKSEGPTNTGVSKTSTQTGEIRVKTLEEIRKEKAARIQAKNQDTTTDKAPGTTGAVPKRRVLGIAKSACKLIHL